jgi:1-acyl-sn-glycerol-3-phosphate acyltransferase
LDRRLKVLFFALVIKPLVFVMLGLNLRGRNHLPRRGPAIIAANHNSHLDAMVLMSLYPLSQLHRVRPVAAADYFTMRPLLRWFSLNCIGIIPLERGARKGADELFSGIFQALDRDEILILFPEGSRGEPEKMGAIKKGLFHIVRERPNVPVIPVVMHGLGRSLPRGEALFVPFNCDVIIGEPMPVSDKGSEFVSRMKATFETLLDYCLTRTEADE